MLSELDTQRPFMRRKVLTVETAVEVMHFLWLTLCLHVCLSVCLSLCPSLSLSVCLSLCLSVSLSVCLSVSLSLLSGTVVEESKSLRMDFISLLLACWRPLVLYVAWSLPLPAGGCVEDVNALNVLSNEHTCRGIVVEQDC